VQVSGAAPLDAIRRWPGAIAYVPQDVAVSNADIRRNVALGLPADAIDDELVWEALRRAHLAEVLIGQREGLDTMVGERGIKLSGGQRQRLGLARALYSRPQVLVLDEATSALDAETEAAIAASIAELSGSTTLVIIAHRLATIRTCDQVAYLEAGVPLAIGTFEQVRGQVEAFERQAALLGL
jgi:ABC-type multidrug transport system fused ATPase/permease subunit